MKKKRRKNNYNKIKKNQMNGYISEGGAIVDVASKDKLMDDPNLVMVYDGYYGEFIFVSAEDAVLYHGYTEDMLIESSVNYNLEIFKTEYDKEIKLNRNTDEKSPF